MEHPTPNSPPPQNLLLAEFADNAAVSPILEFVVLSAKAPLDAEAYVYFPCTGLIVLRDPSSGLQAALVGNKGSSGLFLRRGLQASVLINGEAWRIRRGGLHDAAKASQALEELLLTDNDHLVRQMISALCGAARKDIKQRIAAWLLAARHHCGSDTLQLTQDDLAHLLGVRRPSITIALQQLEASGAARAARGRIIIRDAERLTRFGAAPADSFRPLLRLSSTCHNGEVGQFAAGSKLTYEGTRGK